MPIKNYMKCRPGAALPFILLLSDVNTRGEAPSPEDAPDKFSMVLERIREGRDVDEPGFLDSPIGRYYREVENFTDIRESFTDCAEDAPALTGGSMERGLTRLADNASEGFFEDGCASLMKARVLSDANLGFMNDVDDISRHLLRDEIVLDSLGRSIGARISFEQKFNDEDVSADSFQNRLVRDLCRAGMATRGRVARRYRNRWVNVCSPEDGRLVRRLVRERADGVSRLESPPERLDAARVEADVNRRISRLNEVLADYNEDKRGRVAAWAQEDAGTDAVAGFGAGAYHRRQAVRDARDRELKELKREAFDEYHRLLSSFHLGGAGPLLSTDAVKGASGMGAMTETEARFFGFGGFSPKVLGEARADFPLLKPIDRSAAGEAMAEGLAKTKEQVQRDLRGRREHEPDKVMDELVRLVGANPASAGHVLKNEPRYAGLLCGIVRKAAVEERNHGILETGTYVLVGAGLTVATATSLGGLAPMSATVGGLLAGAAFSAGDYVYQDARARRMRRMERDLVNAFLSGSGDRGSPEDIREAGQAARERDYQAGAGLAFGVFDLLGVWPAARGATFIRAARALDGFDLGVLANRRLLFRMSKSNAHVRGFDGLIEGNSPQKVGELLTFIATLPNAKQGVLLDALSGAGRDARALGRLARTPAVGEALSGQEAARLAEIAGTRPRAGATAAGRTATIAEDLTDAQRLGEARELLGRELTLTQREGLIRAHEVGRGQPGRDGTPAGFGNYTLAQMREKRRILDEAGFTAEEGRLLRRRGLAGSPSVADATGGADPSGMPAGFVPGLPDGLRARPRQRQGADPAGTIGRKQDRQQAREETRKGTGATGQKEA